MFGLFKRPPLNMDVSVLQPGQTVLLRSRAPISDEFAAECRAQFDQWSADTGAKFVLLAGDDFDVIALPMGAPSYTYQFVAPQDARALLSGSEPGL